MAISQSSTCVGPDVVSINQDITTHDQSLSNKIKLKNGGEIKCLLTDSGLSGGKKSDSRSFLHGLATLGPSTVTFSKQIYRFYGEYKLLDFFATFLPVL